MISEYRCARCHHLLFKGSLKLLLSKQHRQGQQFVEPKCERCGLINRFTYEPTRVVEKRTQTPPSSLFDESEAA